MIEQYNNILKTIDKFFLLKYGNPKPSKTKLYEIAEIKYGRGLEASKLSTEGTYPVYGSNGVIGYLETYEFNEAKISISCRGASSGNVLLTKPFSTISSNSLYLNLRNNNILLPLYSYLKQIGLQNFTTGSAQSQITIENIQHLDVPEFNDIDCSINNLLEISFITNKKMEKALKCRKVLLQKYF